MANILFNEAKATQVAARFLKQRGTGKMKFLKLIKLMYLLDREALKAWGWTITTDRHVSMDKGPVLSNVYRLINEESADMGYWPRHITKALDYDVELVADPGTDELSIAEEDLINGVFAAHGHKSRWKLVEELHAVPEWKNPNGSMIPISIREILEALGKDSVQIAQIEESASAQSEAMQMFGAR